jgi:hypothetical protein
MGELLVGAAAASGFILLTRYARDREIPVTRWQWGLTVLGFLFWVFVFEVILSFLREGSPKGAAVMGTILGFIGVVWAVLLFRLVFAGGGMRPTPGAGSPDGTVTRDPRADEGGHRREEDHVGASNATT